MSTPDATIAQPSEADEPLTNGDLAAFALRSEFFLSTYGCVVHVRDGLLFDVGAALREGDGVIVTDDSQVVDALRETHSVVQIPVPQDALITSHQFAEPHEREHHPQEHEIPPGKGLWGADESSVGVDADSAVADQGAQKEAIIADPVVVDPSVTDSQKEPTVTGSSASQSTGSSRPSAPSTASGDTDKSA